MSRFDKMLMAAVMAGQGEALMRIATKKDTASCAKVVVAGGTCESCSGGAAGTYTTGTPKSGETALCGADLDISVGNAANCDKLKGDAATLDKCQAVCCVKKDLTFKTAQADNKMCLNLMGGKNVDVATAKMHTTIKKVDTVDECTAATVLVSNCLAPLKDDNIANFLTSACIAK